VSIDDDWSVPPLDILIISTYQKRSKAACIRPSPVATFGLITKVASSNLAPATTKIAARSTS